MRRRRDTRTLDDFGIEIVHDSRPDLLVVAKPSGMETHAERGRPYINLVDVIKRSSGNFRGFNANNRLDHGTSGLIVGGLHQQLRGAIGKQFERGTVKKHYVALVDGTPDLFGRIEGYHQKTEGNRARITKTPPGNYVHIDYVHIGYENGKPLLMIRLHEGKKHVIRALLAYAGMPIVYDGKYNPRSHCFRRKYRGDPSRLPYHRLHAAHLQFDYKRRQDFYHLPSWISDQKGVMDTVKTLHKAQELRPIEGS